MKWRSEIVCLGSDESMFGVDFQIKFKTAERCVVIGSVQAIECILSVSESTIIDSFGVNGAVG